MYNDAVRRRFEIARREAEKSSYMHYRLGAVTMRKKVIGRGYNQFKTHPVMQSFDDSWLRGIHAEISACLDSKIEVPYLYVCRILKNGEYALAKPCETCQHVLQRFGIEKVFYTIDEENYGVIAL